MIDAYVWTTPNGMKLFIALDELQLPHTLKWIDIGKGEQKTPAFLAINPNNKIPAIVDHTDEGDVTVFESATILQYLGDKTGKLLPPAGPARYTTLAWMTLGAASTGPNCGQLYDHKKHTKDPPAATVERFEKEVNRIFGVLDRRLAVVHFLGGDDFSMADIMNITWVEAASTVGIELAKYEHVRRWHAELMLRGSVQRAYAMTPPA